MRIKNNKGFGITEVIISSTVFIMIFISINNIVNTNNKTFLVSKNETKISSTYSEIYGFLYTFKENYGTYMFKNRIGYEDNSNCTYKINNGSNGTNWCLSYPYYNEENGYKNIYFNQYNNLIDKEKLEIGGTDESIFLLENGNQDLLKMINFIKENKITNGSNKQLLIFYKPKVGDEDFFYFTFRLINYYGGEHKIIFEKDFTLY